MKNYQVTAIFSLSTILVGVLLFNSFALARPSEDFFKRQAELLKKQKLTAEEHVAPMIELTYKGHRAKLKMKWIERVYETMPVAGKVTHEGMHELTSWTAETGYIKRELHLFYKKQLHHLKGVLWTSKKNFFRKTNTIPYMLILAEELYLSESEFRAMTVMMVDYITEVLETDARGLISFKKKALAMLQKEKELSQQERQQLRNNVKVEVKNKVTEVEGLVTQTLGSFNDEQSLLSDIVRLNLDVINKVSSEGFEGKKEIVRLEEQFEKLKKKSPQEHVAIARLKLKIEDMKRIYRESHAKHSGLAINAGKVISFVSLFVAIHDPVESNHIHTLGRSSAIIAASVDTFVDGETELFGPYTAIGGAAFELFNILRDQSFIQKPKIGQQVILLSERVKTFKEETDSRFNGADVLLDPLYTDLALRFIELGNEMNDHRRRTQIVEEAVAHTIIRMARTHPLIASMTLDKLNRDYKSARLWCLARPRLQKDIIERYKELTACIESFADVALVNSRNPRVTGSDKAVETLDIQRGDYEYNINQLEAYFDADYKTLPNPLIWALGTDAYMTVIKGNPELNLIEGYQRTAAELLEQGRQIQKFVLKIQSESFLVDIVSHYEELFEEIFKRLTSVKKEYYKTHFSRRIQQKYDQMVRIADNQRESHKQDAAALKKERKMLKEMNVKLEENPVDFYDDLLSMDSVTENILVNHGALVSPCNPSRHYPNSNMYYTIDVPTYLRDVIFLSQADVERMVPLAYRKAEAFGEGSLKHCYDIQGIPENKALPIGTVYSCVECILEDSFRYRLQRIDFNTDFTFKDGETIRIVEKKVPLTTPAQYLFLDIEQVGSFLAGLRNLWHNGEHPLKEAVVAAENASKELLERNKNDVVALTHLKETDHIRKIRDEMSGVLKVELKEKINMLDALARKIGALSYFGLNRSFNSDDRFWNLLNSLQRAEKLAELVLGDEYLLDLDELMRFDASRTAELKKMIGGKLNDLRSTETDESYALLSFMLHEIEQFNALYNGEGIPPFTSDNVNIEYNENPKSKTAFGKRSYNIDITFLGMGMNVPANVTATLMALHNANDEADHSAVDITKESATFNRSDLTSRISKRLSYRFKKETNGETIRLLIQVFDSNENFFRKVISIKPVS